MEIHKPMSNLAVPNQLNYASGILPIAIESRSQKRTFSPVNGNVFGPTQNNVIRFNINSDNLWDISHSYLQVELQNLAKTGTPAHNHLTLDDGVPWLSRVQIMSGGAELENIDEYARLHCLMQQMQGNPEQAGEWAMTHNQNFPVDDPAPIAASSATTAATATNSITATTATAPAHGVAAGETDMATVATGAVNAAVSAVNTALATRRGEINTALSAISTNSDTALAATTTEVNTAFTNTTTAANTAFAGTATHGIYRHATAGDKHTTLRGGNSETGYSDRFTYNINLISAILSTPKYFPLIFSNLGLDILLYLTPAIDIGVWGDATAPVSNGGYQISKCEWHCHMVDVDRSFYDTLRQQMMSSGGMLQFSGTSYKHYLETASNEGTEHNLSVPTRVKSLNALYIRPQRQSLNNNHNRFCLSVGEGCRMTDYLFRIGSMQYPQQSIKVSSGKPGETNNPGELYNEIRKCNGLLNNYAHTSWLNRTTIKVGPVQLSNTDNSESVDTATVLNTAGTSEAHGTTNTVGQVKSCFIACYNFEGFSRTAAESGINVSDRALPVQCEIKRQRIQKLNAAGDGYEGDAAAEPIRYDVFAQADFLLYLTADGQMSTQV